MRPRAFVCGLLAGLMALPAAAQNQQPYSINKPNYPVLIRSYAAPEIPPIRLTNSTRLSSLIRAGNLYLTVEDAIALAIENNLNLEIARYGPMLADSALERAKAGGPLRGVPSASSQVASADAGLGVAGSLVSAGQSNGGGGGTGGGNGAATIQQIGAITPALDPYIQNTTIFGHLTQPQANTVASQVSSLEDTVHTYNTTVVQRLITGGTVQFVDYEQYLKENSPGDILNPAVGPHMDIYFQHSLLQGFGAKLNNRGIRIAQVNTTASREVFRSTLLNTVVQVVNLYWDLASAREELKARQNALEITRKFVEDTKYEISVGAIAGVEMPRAEAEFGTRRQDVVVAEANVRQRGLLLKDALSHTEIPELDAAEIIPIDRIEIPENEELPQLRQAVTTALAKRPDVAVSNFQDQTSEINLAGTTNPLLPSLTITGRTYDRGTAGTAGPGANPYFVGGYGTALAQIFRRNFPSNSVVATFSAPIGNRQAQADYGIDQLQFRQSQVSSQRTTNQILVDIASATSAIRQARARYGTAQETRVLQEQLLEAEKKKSSGPTTFNAIMADQRQLITAQLAEVAARTAYEHAKISLDQVMGSTLDRYNITLDEGLAGHVNRESHAPDVIEQQGQQGQQQPQQKQQQPPANKN
ncbi:MAG TPA: TolC family protein [Bryobacteraceae bacterium]|nr:TolC family protein [Bryobacteraceae bacterium]